MIALRRADSTPDRPVVYVNPLHIISFQLDSDGMYTRVLHTRGWFDVYETPKVILDLLRTPTKL